MNINSILDAVMNKLSPTMVITNPKVKPKFNSEEMKILKGVAYGESGMYKSISDEELKNEMKTVMNVALNRSKELGKNLTTVLTAPKQFQAYNKDQYKRYFAEDKDAFEKRKAKMVDEVADELQSANWKDNTNGANSFVHFPDEKGIKRMKFFSQKLAK